MVEQLLLAGFEHPQINATNNTASYHRRLTDQSRGGRCSTQPEPVWSSMQGAQFTALISLYTLGRFSLLLNGRPAEFGRKAPRRSLELLKTIVALGGREVSITSLMSALWPDVDGDTAQRSFDTTLHRLRKIIGDDRVLVLKDGKLSLDGQYCWVDLWVFERLLGQSQRLLMRDVTGKQIFTLEQLTENLIGLYQGHFLDKEDITSWSVSMHERLRSKFIHHLLEVGRFMEKHGYLEQAIGCYRKGIDVDDLVEVFYQRLMDCYLRTHCISEGMAVYRRCRQVLSLVLSLQPEPETESLYRSLRDARLNIQSA
jgi:DNA-binding SARP family transcriptional activator